MEACENTRDEDMDALEMLQQAMMNGGECRLPQRRPVLIGELRFTGGRYHIALSISANGSRQAEHRSPEVQVLGNSLLESTVLFAISSWLDI